MQRLSTKKLAFFLAVMALSLTIITGTGARSEAGDGVITVHIYHDYYIPYVPGMDNCYGAYRVVGTRGEQNISVLAMQKNTSPARMMERSDRVNDRTQMYYDARLINRDDVVIFTKFTDEVKAAFKEEKTVGNYHYIITHTFWYETPYMIAGMTADMSPIAGSSAAHAIGRPWTIAVDADLIKKYTPGFKIADLVPCFNGTEPRGKVIKTVELSKKGEVLTGKNNRFAGRNGRDRWYWHILSLDPTQKENTDIIGYWDLYSFETLAMVENARENLVPDRQSASDKVSVSLTEDERKNGNTLTDPIISAGTSWNTVAINFTPDTVKDFGAYTPLMENKISDPRSQLWAFNGKLPTQFSLYEVFAQQATAVERAAASASLSLPWGKESYPLDALISTTPGYWSVPNADVFTNHSMSIFTMDPDMLGKYPFARAQSGLYYDGKASSPTLAGITKAYDSLSRFLGTNIGEDTDYSSIFASRVRKLPFKGGFAYNSRGRGRNTYIPQSWNDPWLPGDPASGSSIWNFWYKNSKKFYLEAVPTMALRLGLTLWDVPDTTAWNLGIKRERLPHVVANIQSNINTTADYSIQEQADVKSRRFADDDTFLKADGKWAKNNVKEIKNYNSAPNVDLGSTRIHGSDFQLFVESYSVRYFPVYPKGFDKLKKKFSFIGDKVSDVEISDLYKKIQTVFPLVSERDAGIGTSPRKWQ